MDGSRFDHLTRSLVHGTSRRRLLHGLTGAIAAAVTTAGRAAPGAAAGCPSGQYTGSNNRCLCRTTGRPPGPGGCSCGPGQTTCSGACVSSSTCCVDGAAVPAGTPNPIYDCQACQPAISASTWTNRSAGAGCGEGRCTGACDGAGTCLLSTPVAMPHDCDGRCYMSGDEVFDADCRNTVTICGQEVNCPACDDWALYGCNALTRIVGLNYGPQGLTCYFLTGESRSSTGCVTGPDCGDPPAICTAILGGLDTCLTICTG